MRLPSCPGSNSLVAAISHFQENGCHIYLCQKQPQTLENQRGHCHDINCVCDFFFFFKYFCFWELPQFFLYYYYCNRQTLLKKEKGARVPAMCCQWFVCDRLDCCSESRALRSSDWNESVVIILSSPLGLRRSPCCGTWNPSPSCAWWA